MALVKDGAGNGGRLHHVAFLYGVQQHLEDIYDILVDACVETEAGPVWQAISHSKFIYVLEPGGNRIELVGKLGDSELSIEFPRSCHHLVRNQAA
nr:VOC family protein [Klebsiella pneumoniae]